MGKKKQDNLVEFKIVDEFDGLEIAEKEQDDFLLLEGVAFHNGVNSNGAYIELSEAKKGVGTFNHKPIRLLWDGYNPTGHGYNPSNNTFSDKVNNIGYIFDAFVDEGRDEQYKAVVRAVVWKKYYPEIAERLVELHSEGNLKFSIEADRDYEENKDHTRRCYNLNFRGLSIVKNPAWADTRSLMVAEDEATADTTQDVQEETLQEEQPKQAEPKQEKKEAAPKVTAKPNENFEEAFIELKEENIRMKQQINELTNSALTYQTIVEQYQIEKVGNERFEKVSKFVDSPKSVEELGKMDSTEFVEYYEGILDDYSENRIENTTGKNQIHALFHKQKEDIDPKNALLDVFKGLS